MIELDDGLPALTTANPADRSFSPMRSIKMPRLLEDGLFTLTRSCYQAIRTELRSHDAQQTNTATAPHIRRQRPLARHRVRKQSKPKTHSTKESWLGRVRSTACVRALFRPYYIPFASARQRLGFWFPRKETGARLVSFGLVGRQVERRIRTSGK